MKNSANFVILFGPFATTTFRGTYSSIEMLKGTWSEKGWEPPAPDIGRS